jgi:hypothetical protein
MYPQPSTTIKEKQKLQHKKKKNAGEVEDQWLTPVILATQKAEIRRIVV